MFHEKLAFTQLVKDILSDIQCINPDSIRKSIEPPRDAFAVELPILDKGYRQG